MLIARYSGPVPYCLAHRLGRAKAIALDRKVTTGIGRFTN